MYLKSSIGRTRLLIDLERSLGRDLAPLSHLILELPDPQPESAYSLDKGSFAIILARRNLIQIDVLGEAVLSVFYATRLKDTTNEDIASTDSRFDISPGLPTFRTAEAWGHLVMFVPKRPFHFWSQPYVVSSRTLTQIPIDTDTTCRAF